MVAEGSHCMKKVKYYYNTNTLRYEKLEVPLRVKLLRILGFLAAAIVTPVLFLMLPFSFLILPKKKYLHSSMKA